MGKVKDSIIEIAKIYLQEVEKSGIRIGKAYLYGSYSRGENRKESDIDIAIISSDFTGDRFQDALRLKKLRWNIDLRIEPMPIKSEDFTEDNPLVNEIIKNGITLIWEGATP